METKVREYHALRFSKPSPLSQHHPTHQDYDLNSLPQAKYSSIDEKKKNTQPFLPPTPCTPRKDHPNSKQGESQSHENGSTRKSRYKNKSKKFMTSPAIMQNIQVKSPRNLSQSLGLPCKSVHTPTNVAYAGPTFHASPAPSSLPIPSFYSKSMPESPVPRNRFSSKNSQNMASPTSFNYNTQLQSQSSPAHDFYKAESNQKERIPSAPPSTTAVSCRPIPIPNFSPYAERPSFIGAHHINGKTSNSKPSASAMLHMELGEEIKTNSPFGAPFSMPYSERIKAVRPDSISKSLPHALKNQQTTSNAEALKAYLFSGHLISSDPSIV